MKSSANEYDQASVALAEAVRDACVKAALNAYENARMDGLCHDGAWEVAVGAMRTLNVERVIKNADVQRGQSARGRGRSEQ